MAWAPPVQLGQKAVLNIHPGLTEGYSRFDVPVARTTAFARMSFSAGFSSLMLRPMAPTTSPFCVITSMMGRWFSIRTPRFFAWAVSTSF